MTRKETGKQNEQGATLTPLRDRQWHMIQKQHGQSRNRARRLNPHQTKVVRPRN